MSYSIEEQNEAFKKTATVKIVIFVQILKMIDIAQSRGAFHPKELTAIGKIYDSLSNAVETAMSSARESLRINEEEIRRPPKTRIKTNSEISHITKPNNQPKPARKPVYEEQQSEEDPEDHEDHEDNSEELLKKNQEEIRQLKALLQQKQQPQQNNQQNNNQNNQTLPNTFQNTQQHQQMQQDQMNNDLKNRQQRLAVQTKQMTKPNWLQSEDTKLTTKQLDPQRLAELEQVYTIPPHEQIPEIIYNDVVN